MWMNKSFGKEDKERRKEGRMFETDGVKRQI